MTETLEWASAWAAGYPRDNAYRDGVLQAMAAHNADDDHQCWYWLFLVAPVRPEWLQTARLYHAVFGEFHSKSVQTWECLFFAAANGEFGPCPAILALSEMPPAPPAPNTATGGKE